MRVLLATDGSTDAQAAAEWLKRLPLPEPTSVRALSVVSPPHGMMDIPTVRAFNDELRQRGRRIVDDARAVLATRWTAVDAELREGDPRAEIPRAAADWGADMIVVGARGLGAFKSWLLGSVSTAVVREATCRVLVVTAPRPGLDKLTVAVDGSPDSVAAARFIASWPLPATATVTLFGVVELIAHALGMVETLTPAVIEAMEVDLRERERKLRKELEGLAGNLVTPARTAAVVEVGAPADRIIAATQDPDVALLVMGKRGLGALKRLVLGSVSERVLHHARCPVLIVK